MLRSAQPSQLSTYPSQNIDIPNLAVLLSDGFQISCKQGSHFFLLSLYIVTFIHTLALPSGFLCIEPGCPRSTQPNHPIYLLLHPAIYQYLKIGRFYTGRAGGAWSGAAAGARAEF